MPARRELEQALADMDPAFNVGHHGALRFLLARALLEPRVDLIKGCRQLELAERELRVRTSGRGAVASRIRRSAAVSRAGRAGSLDHRTIGAAHGVTPRSMARRRNGSRLIPPRV